MLDQPTPYVAGAVVPRRVEDPSGDETHDAERSDYHQRDDYLDDDGYLHARSTM